MDAMEYLTGRRIKMHEVYTAEISLSFCAPARMQGTGLKESLLSINRIASEIGFPYEIIIVAQPGDSTIRENLREIAGKLDNFYVLKQQSGSYGEALRLGYEGSTNRFFIPFNSSLVYDIRYADLIHSFLMKREKKLFLTELPVIHRDLIADAGGYRDLAHSHDIDLYSRIAMMYGVVAYPAMFNKVPLVSPPPSTENLMTPAKKGDSSLRQLRDHIIACNYGIDDLVALYAGDEVTGSFSRKILLSLL